MDVQTKNRGMTARMFFTINIMPETVDGKIDRVALTNKISDVTGAITRAIERSDKKDFTGTVLVCDGKEYIKKDGKLVPKE